MRFFNNYQFGNMGTQAFQFMHAFWPFLVLLLLWSLFWKGLALWHSAKKSQPRWFILFLIINTVGIIEIIYLFGVLKLKFEELMSKK